LPLVKVFISFDFNWWNQHTNASAVGRKIAQYGSKPAQLLINGAVVASSFAGDLVDTAAIRKAAGDPIFWMPNFTPGKGGDFSLLDGALNWMAWENNGNNKSANHHLSILWVLIDSLAFV
jgi:hypothetical protein